MKPSEQKQLYGLDKYINEIIKLHDKDLMPNKILLSGKKGTGKSTLAYHIINYVLSQTEINKYDKKKFIIDNENKSFKLLKNKSHTNFYLIDLVDEKKNIEINQIREMINYSNKSNFNEKPRFILIDNIENLNKNSTNALLKIIEEPNHNFFFILIHNNNKKILSTLSSRCLTFKINVSFEETLKISNFILKENLFNLINIDLINYYNTPGDFINLINFGLEKKIDLKEFNIDKLLFFIIDNNYYKKNRLIKEILINYIELYFLKLYTISSTKNEILDFYSNFIKKMNYTNTFNLDEETLFLEFKSKILNG